MKEEIIRKLSISVCFGFHQSTIEHERAVAEVAENCEHLIARTFAYFDQPSWCLRPYCFHAAEDDLEFTALDIALDEVKAINAPVSQKVIQSHASNAFSAAAFFRLRHVGPVISGKPIHFRNDDLA